MSLKHQFAVNLGGKPHVPLLLLTLIGTGVLAGCGGSDGVVVLGAGDATGTVDTGATDLGGSGTGFGDTDSGGSVVEPVSGGSAFSVGGTGPAGGFVFQLSEDGTSGLEAASVAFVSEWGCDGFLVDVTEGTEPSLGRITSTGVSSADFTVPSGLTISPLLEMQGCTAAGLATGFSGGGFTDWFLPSSEEVFFLNDTGPFLEDLLPPGGGVWTATEQDENNVFVLFPGIDIINTGPLIGANLKIPETGGATFVVPVRAF